MLIGCLALTRISGRRRTYKSLVSRRINNLRRSPSAPVWQRNYHEHIIRSHRALNAIRQHLRDNPARWALDCYSSRPTPGEAPAIPASPQAH